MSCAIFIRTYWKDLDWLALCLRAIARHCQGFAEVVVAVPAASRPWLARQPLPAGIRLAGTPDYHDDYLGQQVSKLYADQFVNADFIAHVDADCMFRRAVSPDLLLPGGRPRIHTRPLAELGRHYPWREPVATFLGHGVDCDFMQQPPFVYPRWLYPALRGYCQDRHGRDMESYVMSRPPRGFSEFNVLGAYALRHHAAAFSFVPMGEAAAADAYCDWYWSWGGLTDDIRRRIEVNLAGEPRPYLPGAA